MRHDNRTGSVLGKKNVHGLRYAVAQFQLHVSLFFHGMQEASESCIDDLLFTLIQEMTYAIILAIL